jgi:hypothetical protein
MLKFPTNPIHQHNLHTLAFCDDLLTGDRDYRRAKAVVEIARQVRGDAVPTKGDAA